MIIHKQRYLNFEFSCPSDEILKVYFITYLRHVASFLKVGGGGTDSSKISCQAKKKKGNFEYFSKSSNS